MDRTDSTDLTLDRTGFPVMQSNAKPYKIQSFIQVDAVPKVESEILWREFGMEMDAMLRQMGGPKLAWEAHRDSFFDKLNSFVPPQGRYYLAYDNSDAVAGHAAMRQVAPGIAEFKHMFVRASARGAGLGRALTVQRMQGAYALGLDTLTVDTFRDNVATRCLYESLGFRQVEPYEASGTVSVTPELAPYIVYYRRTRTDQTPRISVHDRGRS